MSFKHLNETKLIGRLVSMSDLIEISEYSKAVNFTVVTTYTNREGEHETRHRCCAYNAAAESLISFGRQNALIYVSGYLFNRQAREDFENGVVTEIRINHAGDLKVLADEQQQNQNRGIYGRSTAYPSGRS